MKLIPQEIKDVFLVEFDIKQDIRGYSSTPYYFPEFETEGIYFRPISCYISYNRLRGTLRGMHWQAPPAEQSKLVLCIKGKILDVIVDLREKSPTFMKYICVELSERGNLALFVPKGFAHGFQTLENDTKVLYLIDEKYIPELERGFRYDDPYLKIPWESVTCILERDKNFPHISKTYFNMKEKIESVIEELKSGGEKIHIKDNLYLSPLTYSYTEKDIEIMMRWRNELPNPFFTEPKPTFEQTKRFIKSILEDKRRILFFVEEKGEKIAHVGLTNIDVVNRTAEIDNVLKWVQLEKGIMHIALESVIDLAFSKLELNSLFLRIFSDNEKAIKLYKELGFRELKQDLYFETEIDGEKKYTPQPKNNTNVKFVSYMYATK